jgi:hypothetical protein
MLDLFTEIHQPGVICEPDLIPILMRWDERNPRQSLRGFYLNLKAMNPYDQNLSAAAALNQFLHPATHACAGPLFLRLKELTNITLDERKRIDHAVDLLEVYSLKKDPKGIRAFALIAAASVFDYLALRRSPNLPYLAQTILARYKEDPGLVRAILCPGISVLRPDTTVLRQTFREELERDGGIESWARTNLDSKSRTDLYAFTEWPEVLKSMTKKARGHLLEDQLGL